MVKKRGLGRGLEALLGSEIIRQEVAAETEQQLTMLAVDVIRRGKYQPRRAMSEEKLKELADSIKEQGIVQPIVVRPVEPRGNYEIVAGERRWRAAQMAGIHDIPAIVRRIPDQAAVSIALIENVQREDLNPLEEATALERLIKEFQMTHQQVADAIGRSRAAVTNMLRLLELHEEVKQLLETGRLEMGHARALLALPLPVQVAVAKEVVNRKLSVRATEQLVRTRQAPAKKPDSPKQDPDIQRLEQELSERLGTMVSFKHTAAGKGQLSIHYNSLDELDGILSRIK